MAAKCLVDNCDWETNMPSRHIAGCMATWHVFEKHHDIWQESLGDRPPTHPDPRTREGMLQAIAEDLIDAIV